MVTWEEAGRRGDQGETGIYACEPERPLYVVAIIYDTYRSQLRVMALTLVFMAILFLVAFHGRRRFVPSHPSSSPHRCLFLRDFGPYAKQAVILVWFTSTLPPRNSATFNPAGKVITLGSSDKSFMVFDRGVSHIGVARIPLAIATCISRGCFFLLQGEINV